MTEQEHIAERAWIEGQAAKLDAIMLCHSAFHASETRAFLELGFDVVCLARKEDMRALEPLMASCLAGDALEWIARRADTATGRYAQDGRGDGYVLLSMSRNHPVEWFF